MSFAALPDAAQMRALATSANNESVARALAEVTETIRHKAARAECGCSHQHQWGAGVADAVVELLKSKGYRARSESDQREGSWVSVSW